jgi:hypothetical protein
VIVAESHPRNAGRHPSLELLINKGSTTDKPVNVYSFHSTFDRFIVLENIVHFKHGIGFQKALRRVGVVLRNGNAYLRGLH